MDDDLLEMNRDELVAEVKRLRTGIRAHRDSSGHDLCWHHPQLWGLLPERIAPEIAVPPWPKFLRGCVKYRESLTGTRREPRSPKSIRPRPDPNRGYSPFHGGAYFPYPRQPMTMFHPRLRGGRNRPRMQT